MKAILSALSPTTWLIVAAVVLGLVSLHFMRVGAAEKAGYTRGVTVGKAEVQARFDAYKESFRTSMQGELAKTIQANLDLQAQASQRQLEFDNEKSALETTVADLSERLRQRPSRPAGIAGGRGNVPGAPSAAASATASELRAADAGVSGRATGADLWREDALWLLEEARRADELRAAHQRDRAAYEDARSKLNEINEQSQERLRTAPVTD